MPFYELECPICFKKYRRLFKNKDLANHELCSVCLVMMERKLKPFSTNSTEVIDNGIMVKQVEVLTNIHELMENRSKNNVDPLEFELL